MSRAAAMADRAEVRVEDLLGQQGSQGLNGAGGDTNSNYVSIHAECVMF